VWSKGRYCSEYFNREGQLRNIRQLRYWPLEDVLRDKYGFSRREVRGPRGWEQAEGPRGSG
jgi:serine/threonine-protein kinase SRPK3